MAGNAVPNHRKLPVIPCVLGAFFSCATVLGFSFDEANGFGPLTENYALTGAALLVLFLVFSAAIELVYRLLDRVSGNASAPRFFPRVREVLSKCFNGKRAVFWYMAVLLVFWLPWLVSHYPGMTDADTGLQLFQSYGAVPASDHHPWFDTVVFSLFWNAGQALGSLSFGLFLYAAVQLVAVALGFAIAFRFLTAWGSPLGIRMVLLAFVSLMPIFPLAAMFMMKDSLFAAVWLPWFVLFIDVAYSRGGSLSNRAFFIAFTCLSLLCCMTKKTGAYLVLIGAVALFFWVRKDQRLRMTASVALFFVPFLLWGSVALPAMGIPKGSLGEMTSIPSQQVARYIQSYSLTEDERLGIEGVYFGSAEELGELYDPRRSDNTKGRWSGGEGLSDVADFALSYASMLGKHPGTFAAALWNNTYDYFYAKKQIVLSAWPNFEDKYIDWWLSASVEGTTEDEIRSYAADLIDGMESLKSNPPILYRLYLKMMSLPLVGFFFTEALYCSWIPFVFLGYAIRKKSGFGVMVVLPCLVMLLTLIAGPISLARYMPPMMYSAVILVGLLPCLNSIRHRTGVSLGGEKQSC